MSQRSVVVVAPVRTAITRGLDVTRRLDALRAGRWEVLSELSAGRPLVPIATAHPGAS